MSGAPVPLPPPTRTSAPGWVHGCAFLGPLLGAAALIEHEPLLRSDSAIIATLGQAETWSLGLSTLLGRWCLHLPLGNVAFRLALPSVLGAALLGYACFQLCYGLFRAQGGYSRLDPWLAWGASLVAAFNLPNISEATVPGGATLGPALALSACAVFVGPGPRRDLASSLSYAVLFGALLCESVLLALLVVVAAALLWPDHGARRPSRTSRSDWMVWPAAAGTALFTAGLIASSNGWLSDGWTMSPTPSRTFAPARPLEWWSALGTLWCLGAAFALAFSLTDRRPLYVMGLFVVCDWLLPSAGIAGWVNAAEADPGRNSLHVLCLGYVAAAGALGLRTFGETAHAMGLWGAQQLSALLSIVAVAGGLAASEDALLTLSQTEAKGAQAWTEAAFFALPPRALVITHSHDRGRRLRAAQLVGARPDVLVVPLSELSQARNVASWMKREPALQLLLIDLSLGGSPSERALATLVDTRPVYVEPKPDWDPRLLEHLEPAVPLSRLSPHALGRSERLAALDQAPPIIDQLVLRSRTGIHGDDATLALLEQDLEQLATTLKVVDHVAEERVRDLSPFVAPGEKPELAPVARGSLSARR